MDIINVIMMRYELNFDEDKVNDVLVKGGASYDLKGCCKVMNEQQATITAQKKGLDEYMDNIIALSKENEKLRKELDNFKPVMFQDMRKGTVILYSKGD